MSTSDVKELRRRLAELEETKRWVHHVGDLNSGKVLTFPLDRPITPLSRAERLSRLGHPFDTSIFDGPRYKLTPNSPFLISPYAGLTLEGNPNYYYDYMTTTGEPPGLIVWTVPQEKVPLSFTRVAQFGFEISSQPGQLVSIALQFAAAYPGKVGHIYLIVGDAQARFEINDMDAAHTLDVYYNARGSLSGIQMFFDGYLSFATFESFSFGPSIPPVFSTQTP